MSAVLDWFKTRRTASGSPEEGGTGAEAGGPLSGFLLTVACAFLSILASTLLSGTLVFCIVRFGAGSGLPPLGFRGALSVALLGAWFSMGGSQPSEGSPQDFLGSLARTLTHQVGCALLMLALLGALGLGIGGR